VAARGTCAAASHADHWLDLRPISAALEDVVDPFRRGLLEMGFVDGRNVTIVHRPPDQTGFAALAADLVRQRVSLIFAPTAAAAKAAKEATQTIPVVFFSGLDPIEAGLVTSLNRPGGNVTGVAMLAIDIGPKRLDLLHKLVPTAEKIGMLTGPPGNLAAEADIKDMPSAAQALGLRVLLLHAQTDSDFAAAFGTLAEEKGGALLVSAIVSLDARRDQIIALGVIKSHQLLQPPRRDLLR
jgi:putative ABC transport system substrate-binding protein